MRRKLFLTINIIVILSFTFYFGFKAYKIKRIKSETAKSIKYLPALNQFFNDSIILNTKDKPVIVYYFSPNCEHCQFMAKEIKKHIHDFSNTAFLMITSGTQKEINEFIKEYLQNTQESVKIGIDSTFSFYKTFGTFSIPSFFVYDKEHLLVKQINGEIKIEYLIKLTQIGKKN